VDKNAKGVLIISGGKSCDGAISLLMQNKKYSLIIVADSGLVSAERLGIVPDYILGDFDSVSRPLLERYKTLSSQIISYPPEKDMTDTQIAIELAISHNPAWIDICGATGSRVDHMLANIHLLLMPLRVGIDACIYDDNNKIYLRNKSFTIMKDEQYGSFVSLLPFTDEVYGITLEGFKYPLYDYTLSNGSSIAISNEIAQAEGRVFFKNGILLVVESRD